MSERTTLLPNGLRIVSECMPAVDTTALALLVNAGARNETAGENGLAHLFEHMVFKGTAGRSARRIAEEIEDVGGSLNAWTSRDSTCFHARVLADDVPLALDLVADLVTGARFDPADLALERGVVLSELAEALDTPDDLVFDSLQQAAFPGQSLGRPVLGSAESLAGFGPQSLRHWQDSCYRGSGLVLAAAGRVDHDRLVDQAARLFVGLAAAPDRGIEPAHWVGGCQLDAQENEQLHIALGFQGFAAAAAESDAARLFAMALGGGMSSRLFQDLRETRGLAYSVSASHGTHADIGLLTLYAATRPADGSEALARLHALARETSRTLDAAELDRARAQLKAGILFGLEGCAGRADWLAASLQTFGRILSGSELIARLDRVSLEEVRAAGVAMLGSPPALAAVGPNADRLAIT